MNKVLSQEEMNDFAQMANSSNTHEQVYDLASQDINMCSRIQNIGLVNERFAKLIKFSLSSLCKKNVQVTIENTIACKVDDYIHSLSFPTSINHLNVLPINSSALLIMDPAFVFCLVESFFGGEGKNVNKIFNQNFTTSENRIIKLVLTEFIKILKESWMHLLELQFVHVKTEVDPTAFKGIEFDEQMVVSKFKIEINNIGGECHVGYLGTMIDSTRDYINTHPTSFNENGNKNYALKIQDVILAAKVELHCILAHKTLSIKEIMKFKKGDILFIDIPEEMILSSAKIPLFKTNFGTFEGKYAVKIIKKITPEEENN